jgi:hypothetical protein
MASFTQTSLRSKKDMKEAQVLTRIATKCHCLLLLLTSCLSNVVTGAPCEGAAHRQFDFWLGYWEVRVADGKVAGSNRITSEYDGCVIHEHYETGRGYRGGSLNSYDAGRGAWHQTWVDNQGTVLLLEGGLQDGNMVLAGETTDTDGQVTRQRITWTPNADGTVRQLWESIDAAGTTAVVFDGTYFKQKR